MIQNISKYFVNFTSFCKIWLKQKFGPSNAESAQIMQNFEVRFFLMNGSQGIYVHQCATIILSSHCPYNYLSHVIYLYRAKPRPTIPHIMTSPT
jgi:hypothetical protein